MNVRYQSKTEMTTSPTLLFLIDAMRPMIVDKCTITGGDSLNSTTRRCRKIGQMCVLNGRQTLPLVLPLVLPLPSQSPPWRARSFPGDPQRMHRCIPRVGFLIPSRGISHKSVTLPARRWPDVASGLRS